MIDEWSASTKHEEINLLSQELTSYLPPQKTTTYRMTITPYNQKNNFQDRPTSFLHSTSAPGEG